MFKTLVKRRIQFSTLKAINYSNFHKCEVAIRSPKSCPIRIRRTSVVRKPLYIFKIKQQSCHLDSSSLSVEGDYKLSVKREDQEESIIHITRGYSKDKRPDLKQFVLNMVCWQDGDIPAFLKLGDGNQSDKKEFAQLLVEFKKQWNFEGL